ncbi:MAG: cobyrinate a,c-diamide synthase, partial [Rhodospirillales bacterium]|nr:cobyrinate a,c-diamide synthase [Rhodospirillales bacterium]
MPARCERLRLRRSRRIRGGKRPARLLVDGGRRLSPLHGAARLAARTPARHAGRHAARDLIAAPGLILAAPASGSGKTTLALGLLRALARRGLRVSPAKTGPDYIDPTFHAAAAKRTGRNLDPWAMRPATLDALLDTLSRDADLVLCEGVMGLFDGIDARGTGSTADLAARTGWPVVLVVDARGLAASAGPLVSGFVHARPDLRFAGVVFNRTGGPSHVALLREALALACPDIPCLGAVPRAAGLQLPERHLGLVPAGETPALEEFLERAADACAAGIDLEALVAAAAPARGTANGDARPLAPLGQRIAVARDAAFVFAYPATLEGWRAAGAEISFFSPLADEAPDPASDAVFLPGGYPELHAGRLAA